MRHIIDLSDLKMEEFNELYKLTSNIIDRPEGYTDACRGKVLGSLFYEPSTRTNLSFSTAISISLIIDCTSSSVYLSPSQIS